MVENYSGFKKYFTLKMRDISAKTMLNTMGEIDEDILDGNICWLMADNLLAVLAKEQIYSFNKGINMERVCNKSAQNPIKLLEFLNNSLDKNCIIQIFTDSCDEEGKSKGQDHRYIVIGVEKEIILIEWSEKECHVWERQNKEVFIDWMLNMMIGKAPPRFGAKPAKHVIEMWAFNRKPMTKKSIKEYLKED